jgi:hypothetical protein
VALIALLLARSASAAPALAALARADDARKAVAIGAAGEVYEGDGKGAWLRRLPCATASALTAAGRAGDVVVATGDGVVYQLAGNGWSAIRLVQHGKAVLGVGPRAVAAVGRQLFALDGLTRGEPTKLAVAPGNVVALAAGAKDLVVATDAGLFRLGGNKPAPIAAAGRPRLVSERWAIVDRGALDLTTGKVTAWPAGLAIGVAATAPDGALIAVAADQAGLVLLTVRGAAVTREPVAASGRAVGVVVDRAGRAVIALADGKLAVKDRRWSIVEVADAPATERPGAGPATGG